MTATATSPRHRGPRWTLGAALATGLLLVVAGCGSSSSGTTSPSASASSSDGIGAWPTFLPSPSANSMATGSQASPAMSYPGSPVVAEVTGGRVRVDVEGPTYPSSTKVGADQVSCTFTITFSEVSATVTLTGARFDVLDSQGGIHQLAAARTAPMPATLAPGATSTVKVTGTLPSGEGLLRFYPVPKHDAVAAWDYVAETD